MKPDAERQFLEFCQHIVDWGERIPAYIGQMGFEEFARDGRTHLAVWKCVEVIGEASSRILKLDPALATQFPELQLRSAYAMRNRLTHDYSDVDLTILWTTINDFIPPMIEAARRILRDRKEL